MSATSERVRACATIAGLVSMICASSCGGTVSGSVAGKIALLLPETKTARYEAADRPDFLARLQALGYDASNVIYSNANQDASAQQAQADAAITNGARVLVLDPVDSRAAAVIATKAKQSGIPVIAYDRLITGSDGVGYYISFDNERVGQIQAQALVDALSRAAVRSPRIVMINGSPTDNNAALFKKGAHDVFDPLVRAGRLTIAREYDTPDWSPDKAQTEMQQALTSLGNHVDGVYAANDGTAGGVVAAMRSAEISPIPPVTGQDAELAGIQRVIAGTQYMTVYKAVEPEASAAANAALALASGQLPDSGTFSVTVNNGTTNVHAAFLTPVAVTKDNVKDTVVRDSFLTTAQICTAPYAAACRAAGLTS